MSNLHGHTPRSLVHGKPAHPARSPHPRLVERNARVASYLKLVRPIACFYQSRSPEPLDDLLQVGLIGLLRAAELYQDGRQTPFAAFARPHIRGAILHYLRDQARPVRLSRGQMELEDRVRQLKRRPQAVVPGRSEAETLRLRLGLSEAQWQRFVLAQQLARPVSLDALAVELAEEPADAGSGVRGQDLLGHLGSLEPRCRRAVQLVVLTGLSLRRAAVQLQTSPSTVQRDLRKGLGELRQRLEGVSPPRCRAASAVPGC